MCYIQMGKVVKGDRAAQCQAWGKIELTGNRFVLKRKEKGHRKYLLFDLLYERDGKPLIYYSSKDIGWWGGTFG